MTSGSYRPGDRVVFTYYHGEEVRGVVTSVGERYVFVRFGEGKQGESCDPSMLRLDPAAVDFNAVHYPLGES